MAQFLQTFSNMDLSLTTQRLPGLFDWVLALVILSIGRWLARRARRWFQRVAQGTDLKLNQSLVKQTDSLLYYTIIIFALIVALGVLGIPLIIMVTILAAVFILLAIAFQSSLSNFAATIIFLVFQTFKAGDWIEAANAPMGQVPEIHVFQPN